MVFALYSSSTNGVGPIWTENQTVNITDSNYNIQLGSQTPFALSFDRQYYLGIYVEGYPDSPLKPIESTAYAIRSGIADSLASGAVTTASIAEGAITDVLISGTISGSKLGNHFHSFNEITSGVLSSSHGGAGPVNGILMADGYGQVSSAVAGKDYALPVFASYSTAGLMGKEDKAKLSNIKTYNVMDFGAVGDGSTDDTKYCQNAIDAAVNAGGGAVYFPLKHKVDSLNVNGSNLTIYGDGFNSQILFNDNKGDGLRVGSSTPTTSYTQSVTIRDLQLRAYGSNHTGAAIKLDAVWYPVVSNIQIFDTFGGILLGGTHSPQISNINIWSGQYFNSAKDTYYIKLTKTNAIEVDIPTAAFFSNIQLRYSNADLTPTNAIKHGVWIQSADMAMFNNIHNNVVLNNSIYLDASVADADI